MFRIFFLTMAFIAYAYATAQGKDMTTQTPDQQVKMFFDKADKYMDNEQYDSAQTWLNKIASVYPVRQASLFNYYLFSRRAEVDYYNGLNQLGITNANRGLNIARKLHDRILLQDACNILGLLYLGMDSLQQGKHYFLRAVHAIVAPPYPKDYLYQSMPHHIYGNLAEAYEKMRMFDSAYYFSKRSLDEAHSANNQRGIAIACNSLARIFFHKLQPDSALHYYSISDKVAVQAKEYDVQLLNQSGIANVYSQMQDAKAAGLQLRAGLLILDQHSEMNTYFKREFLKEARKICSFLGDREQLRTIIEKLLELEEKTNKKHFNQVQFILNNSIDNEARYLQASLEQDKKSKQLRINQLYIVILILCLLGIIMAFYQYSVREKLKLSVLKNKISQDLHDDVGASLSSINMSAALAEKLMDVNPGKAKTVLQGISASAEDGISTLSDIVWAMKPQSDAGTTFESKVKNYGYNLLSVNDISCSYDIAPGIESSLSNIELRKNLLLLIKEAFNNIAKHSHAAHVSVALTMLGRETLKLQIRDDGRGFEKAETRQGNGIQNMEKRTASVQGTLSIISAPGKGTIIEAVFRI